ncbi:hypothetical protein R1sor_011975 [Riccia sorocarpa]|uniref:Kinesin motor domain-containing protein n=1 Tax=Riccia sorocarpa TaxID=122646 RepID=A0ABD3I4C3_9MARC
MPGNTRHFEYPGRDQARSPLDAGNFLPETRRHQPSSSESQTTTRSKTQNVTLLRSSSGKIPAEDGKPASGWYHLSTNRDELRGLEHRYPPSGGVRRASMNSPHGQKKESSSVHHLSSSSKEKHENSSEGRKRRTENEQDRERAEKNSSSSSEVSSFTSRKSFKELAMAGLPEKSRKESQKSKEKTPGVTSWESTQSSTDYYMLGVASMKSNTSATEFKIMGKSVKTSTSLDYDNKERRRTEVYEAEGRLSCVSVDTQRCTIQVRNTKNPDMPPKLFTFDRTYGSSSTQREVYDDVAHSIVHSVMCGYNGTILAYGQTASGKTFTMDGLDNPQEMRGIIPNAFEDIFAHIEQSQSSNHFLLRASYLEIYNEEIRDLLAQNSQNPHRLELKESGDTGVYVKNLTSVTVQSVPDINRLLSVHHFYTTPYTPG